VPEDVMKCGIVDELFVDLVEYPFLPPLERPEELELVVGWQTCTSRPRKFGLDILAPSPKYDSSSLHWRNKWAELTV